MSIQGGAVPLDPNSTQNDELTQYDNFVNAIKDVRQKLYHDRPVNRQHRNF